jgi:rhomboid protease GluP
VGASGGIFGLLGASIVFAFRYRGVLPRRVRTIMGTALLPWVAINVVFGFLVPVIDMNAHLGGLCAGAVATFFVPAVAIEEVLSARRRELPRFLASLCLALLLVSFLAAGRNIFRLRGESGALLDPRVAGYVEEVDREEVLRRIDEELATNPHDTSLLAMRAEMHMVAEEWAPAIADYRRVVELAPENAGALNNLAWILLEEAPPELQNRADADRLATRALSLEPENPYVQGTYGTVRLRAGDAAEAIVHLRLALAVERRPVDEASDRYLLATALARDGQPEEARELILHARTVDPGNRYRGEAETALERARP